MQLRLGLLESVVLEVVTRMLVEITLLDHAFADHLADARADGIDEGIASADYENVDVAHERAVRLGGSRGIEDQWLGTGGRVRDDTVVGEGHVVEIDLVGEGEQNDADVAVDEVGQTPIAPALVLAIHDG